MAMASNGFNRKASAPKQSNRAKLRGINGSAMQSRHPIRLRLLVHVQCNGLKSERVLIIPERIPANLIQSASK